MNANTTATLLVNLEALCGETEDVQFRDSYSGRGMYGSECVGITGSLSNCMNLITEVVKKMADDLVRGVDDGKGDRSLYDFNKAVEVLLDFKQDSMGRDIILYWTDLSSEPAEEQDES